MSKFKTLDVLMTTIKTRIESKDENSYTVKLVNRGREKICQKVGEEAVELALAAVQDDKKEAIKESADLLYHICVLWADMDIKPKQIMRELQKREGLSGLDEKKNRKSES